MAAGSLNPRNRFAGRLLLLGAAVGLATGCRRAAPATIAVVPRTSGTMLWEPEHRGAQAAASELGLRIYWNASTREDDVDGQIALVERITAGSYKGLVLAPDHSLALITPVRRALASGLPTVIVSSRLPIPADENLSYILNDEEEGGRLAAQRVAELTGGQGSVAVIGINPDVAGIVARANSLEHFLTMEYPRVHIVVRRPGSFNVAHEQQEAREVLKGNPGLNVIVALTSPSTHGAVSAIEGSPGSSGIKVIGFDPDSLFFENTALDSLVLQDTAAMGEQAVRSIDARLAGQPFCARDPPEPGAGDAEYCGQRAGTRDDAHGLAIGFAARAVEGHAMRAWMRVRTRARRRAVAWWLSGALLLLGGWGLVAHLRSSDRGLPYHDSFAKGHADEWKAFGGTWELVDGAMRNDSDERGAKLLTGLTSWRDYSVDADVMLLGLGGDAGLVLRSSDEEQGVDAYTGYYAGLRTIDNSLVLGRAGHGWMEVWDRLNPQRFTIRPTQWYHLRFLAYGCQLAASVTIPPQTAPTTIAVTDADCVRSGRAGLRSYASGGIWRNVVARAATQHDLAAMLATLGTPEPNTAAPQLPWQQHASWDYYGSNPGARTQALPSTPNAQQISTLRLTALTKPVMATVRGVVVLASPALFVEDSTGGVSVQQSEAQALKVGDEVEVTGTVREDAFSATLEGAKVRVLWEGTPMPPVSVTASQAATGAFDSTFIEVEGRLVRKQYGPGDTLLFDFDAGPQSFRAIMNRGRGDFLYGKLKANSILRLRGVAVSDPAYTHHLVPFAILLRSTDDAIVVAGPPWWSAGHAVALAAAFLLLAILANFMYHRVESWRLRAVMEERERLAFEMHDTLSQSFAGIGFQLQAIREAMPGEDPRLRQQLDLAHELVRHSHEETRRSIAVLRPERPKPEGLLEALTACANYLVEGGSVRIAASASGDAVKTSLRLTDTLYRIGQEALANAVGHGHPSTIFVRVAYEDRRVCLSIEDDGVGFTPSDDLHGFGIRGMRKRAAGLGATLEIESRPGEGTRVSVIALAPARARFVPWPDLSPGNLWRNLRDVTGTGKFDTNSYRR